MIGTKLAHFRITAKLDEGGMGEVYRAEDTRLEREVALEFVQPHITEQEEEVGRQFTVSDSGTLIYASAPASRSRYPSSGL